MLYDDEVGVISCFEKPLEINEYNELFEKAFGNILNENIRKKHLEYQEKFLNMFKKFYLENGSRIVVRFRYFDMMDDIGLDKEENQFLYNELEKAQLKKVLSSLGGEELLYGKKFKIEKLSDLEIILKFQLRTFRTVDFYFENLNLMFKGSYEYNIIVYGYYKEDEYNGILKGSGLYYKSIKT